MGVQQRRFNFLLILAVPVEQRDKILIGKPFLKTSDFSVEIRTSIPKLWRLTVSQIPHWVSDGTMQAIAPMFGIPKHVITTSATLFVTTRTLVAFYESEPPVQDWPADEALQSVRLAVAEPMLLQAGSPAPAKRTSTRSAQPAQAAPQQQQEAVPPTAQVPQAPSVPPPPTTPKSPSHDARLAEIRKTIAAHKAELTTANKRSNRKKELEDLIDKLMKEAVKLQPDFKL